MWWDGVWLKYGEHGVEGVKCSGKNAWLGH